MPQALGEISELARTALEKALRVHFTHIGPLPEVDHTPPESASTVEALLVEESDA